MVGGRWLVVGSRWSVVVGVSWHNAGLQNGEQLLRCLTIHTCPYHLQPITYHPTPTTYHLPPTTYHLPNIDAHGIGLLSVHPQDDLYVAASGEAAGDADIGLIQPD